MNRSYFLMLVLALALVLGAFVLTGAGVGAFVDPASLAVVLGFAVLMSFASHSPREIGRSFRVAFAGQEASRVELDRALIYFEGLARYLAYGGLTGVVAGLVAVLGFLADANTIGRAIAMCLLAVLYATILTAVVAAPFRAAVRKRIAELAA